MCLTRLGAISIRAERIQIYDVKFQQCVERKTNRLMTDDKFNTSVSANSRFQRTKLVASSTLKMISAAAQVVEMLVTNNSYFQKASEVHSPDDHIIRTIVYIINNVSKYAL